VYRRGAAMHDSHSTPRTVLITNIHRLATCRPGAEGAEPRQSASFAPPVHVETRAMALQYAWKAFSCQQLPLLARAFGAAPAARTSMELIKELREKSGAPISDVKTCLEQSNWEVDTAYDLLRKRGLAAAAKKASRLAAEGLVGVHSSPGLAAVVEINSETDFVPRNQLFKDLVASVAKAAAQLPASAVGTQHEVDLDSLQQLQVPGSSSTVQELVSSVASQVRAPVAQPPHEPSSPSPPGTIPPSIPEQRLLPAGARERAAATSVPGEIAGGSRHLCPQQHGPRAGKHRQHHHLGAAGAGGPPGVQHGAGSRAGKQHRDARGGQARAVHQPRVGARGGAREGAQAACRAGGLPCRLPATVGRVHGAQRAGIAVVRAWVWLLGLRNSHHCQRPPSPPLPSYVVRFPRLCVFVLPPVQAIVGW
jgi:hypothetical protein